MEKTNKVFYLDFIRAIATIMIISVHYNGHLEGTYGIKTVTMPFYNMANGNWSGPGVDLFFIISGAALMLNYNQNINIKEFYKKRFKSIFPMFWLAYIIVFSYRFYLYGGISDIPRWKIIFSVIGMDGYFNYLGSNFYILGEWFLGAIIFFYLLYPLMLKLIEKMPRVLFVVFTIITVLTIQFNPFQISLRRNLIVCLYCCLLGMYYVKYIKQIKLPYIIVCALVSCYLITNIINIDTVAVYIVIAALLFIVLAYIAEKIKCKPIEFVSSTISKYSYSVFLVHHVVIVKYLLRFKSYDLSLAEGLLLQFVMVCIIGFYAKLLYELNGYVTMKLSNNK